MFIFAARGTRFSSKAWAVRGQLQIYARSRNNNPGTYVKWKLWQSEAPPKWPTHKAKCWIKGCFLPKLNMTWKLSATMFAIVFLLGLAGVLPASARSSMPPEDPLSPAHIERLPREVRASIERSTRACGPGVAARHFFSRYIQDRITGDRFIAIHFDEVYCINRAALCATARCLHQVYVSKGGPYRAIFNVYAPEIELKLLDGAAVVEIACGQTAEACARDFRWDGSHLRPLK